MGIVSIILGAIGLLSSYWYVGALLCIAGFILGIVDFKESSSDGKYSIFGILSSLLGFILSIFFVISDIDSGSLDIASKKFGTERKEEYERYDYEGMQAKIDEALGDYDFEEREEAEETGENEESVLAEEPQPIQELEKHVEEAEDKTDIQKPEENISKEEFILQCEEISYDSLARSPEYYIGEKIKVTVKVQQIVQGGWFDNNEYYRVYTNDELGMWMGNEYFMFDERESKNPKILQDDVLAVYGEFDGTQTVTRALTNTKENVPSFKAKYIELIDEDSPDALPESAGKKISDTEFEYDGMNVKYLRHETGTDDYGDRYLIVYFDFANNSGENKSFDSEFSGKAFQNGVQLDSYYMKVNDESENYGREIQTGTKITVGKVFSIGESNSDVTIQIEPMFSMSNTKLMDISLTL